jgi:hypothetical protein
LARALARENQFIVGLYRRRTNAIRYLGSLERVFRVPVTPRNWNTITAIARVLGIDDAFRCPQREHRG